MTTMVEGAGRVIDDPVPLLRVHHLPSVVGQHACRPRVEDEQAGVAEVAKVRPPACSGLAVAHVGESAEPGARVLVLLHELEHRFLCELGWRQIAQVLVDPVRHEGTGDPGLPPGLPTAFPAPNATRCSSRRGRRGRRRSSLWARSRTASESRDPPTTRGRGGCIPRSRRFPDPEPRVVSRRLSMNSRVAGDTSSAYT